jgi:hypothetical protein
MVKSAQKGIPEGRVFEMNSARLKSVGSERLQDMLDRRDWSGLPLYSPYALQQASKNKNKKSMGRDIASRPSVVSTLTAQEQEASQAEKELEEDALIYASLQDSTVSVSVAAPPIVVAEEAAPIETDIGATASCPFSVKESLYNSSSDADASVYDNSYNAEDNIDVDVDRDLLVDEDQDFLLDILKETDEWLKQQQ